MAIFIGHTMMPFPFGGIHRVCAVSLAVTCARRIPYGSSTRARSHLLLRRIHLQPKTSTAPLLLHNNRTSPSVTTRPRAAVLSVVDPQAQLIIDLVRQGRYSEAEQRMHEKKISIDAHPRNENTVLTDCAKRGDLEGGRWALRMGASVWATCDCPRQQSAGHYAAGYGHLPFLRMLVDEAQLDPASVRDADGRVPLDTARQRLVQHQREHARRQMPVIGAIERWMRPRGSAAYLSADGVAQLVLVQEYLCSLSEAKSLATAGQSQPPPQQFVNTRASSVRSQLT